MSNAARLSPSSLVQTLAGFGVLAAIGLASTRRDLLARRSARAARGHGWTGVVARRSLPSGRDWALRACAASAACDGGAATRARASHARSSSPARARAARDSLVGRAGVVGGALWLSVAVLVAAAAAVPSEAARGVRRLGDVGNEVTRDRRAGSGGSRRVRLAAYARLHLEYPLLLPSLHALPLQLDGRLLVQHDRSQLPCDRARWTCRGLGAASRIACARRFFSVRRGAGNGAGILRPARNRLRRCSGGDASSPPVWSRRRAGCWTTKRCMARTRDTFFVAARR